MICLRLGDSEPKDEPVGMSRRRKLLWANLHPCRTGGKQGQHDGSLRLSGDGPNLKIEGIDNLFIADASIFPAMITVNINCAVMMAAEKAASLISRHR